MNKRQKKREVKRQNKDTLCIKIVGVGDGASNIMNRLMEEPMPVNGYIAINADRAALDISKADVKVQIGEQITEGLGTSDPEIGRLAAESDRERIAAAINGCDWLLLIACLGGGTGTGATPVVADTARSKGISTAAIVTTPFRIEGSRQKNRAENGIELLRNSVDTLTVIPNEDHKDSTNSFADAFALIDHAITQKIKSMVAINMDENKLSK